jgi:hypothetical protein
MENISFNVKISRAWTELATAVQYKDVPMALKYAKWLYRLEMEKLEAGRPSDMPIIQQD